MKIVIGLVAAVVLIGALALAVRPLLGPAPTPPPTAAVASTPPPTLPPTPTPTASPSPAPLVSARGNIIVEQPRGSSRTRSPLTISGRVRLFEAAYQWRVVDLGGKELAKGFGTASAGAPEFGTFTISATFTVTAETTGYAEVFSTSARDGSIDEVVRIPITMLP